ncbi:glycosyltransferase [Butyrivibrio sp. FCS006]|uniref:glycosyltransferase n=1 Tax=Butyrivibrio sp. FCS006 TaxID=1280684 RepID=UPI000425FBAD|nr:glycosyltransferase [Butyrivibrio sp. FCS006]
MAKYKKFVSVVAYLCNAEESVENFIENVMGQSERLFEKCELVLVNDASNDGSLEKVKAYFETHPANFMVSIVKLATRQGLETAMNAGRDLAIGDFIFEFDDMFVDYDMSVIGDAFEECLKGNDVVSVSADTRIKLSSKLFYHVYNRFSGAQNPIGNETFRLLSRRAVNRVKAMGVYIPYRKAVYMNSGLKVSGIRYTPVTGREARGEHSVKKKRAGLAVDSFIYFTNVMEKVSLGISVVFFIVALCVVIYVAQSYFMDEHLESGWVSVMGFLSIGFLGIFSLLTIVLKYLSVLVNLVFKQQRYLVEDVEKISGN